MGQRPQLRRFLKSGVQRSIRSLRPFKILPVPQHRQHLAPQPQHRIVCPPQFLLSRFPVLRQTPLNVPQGLP